MFTLHVHVNFTWHVQYVTKSWDLWYFLMICLLKRSITPLWRPLFIIEMPYSSISVTSHFCIYNPTICRLSGILHLANDRCRSLDYFCKIFDLLPQILHFIFRLIKRLLKTKIMASLMPRIMLRCILILSMTQLGLLSV